MMYYKITIFNGDIYIKKVLPIEPFSMGRYLGEWYNTNNRNVLYTNVPIYNSRLQGYLRELKCKSN